MSNLRNRLKSLAKIQKFSTHESDELSLALKEAQQRLEAVEDIMATLKAQALQQEKLASQMSDPLHAMNLPQFRALLSNKLHAMEMERARHQKEVDHLREQLIERLGYQKSVEKLHEKYHKQFQDEILAKEQLMLDDTAITQWQKNTKP